MLFIVTSMFGTRAFRNRADALEQARAWGRCSIRAIRVRPRVSP